MLSSGAAPDLRHSFGRPQFMSRVFIRRSSRPPDLRRALSSSSARYFSLSNGGEEISVARRRSHGLLRVLRPLDLYLPSLSLPSSSLSRYFSLSNGGEESSVARRRPHLPRTQEKRSPSPVTAATVCFASSVLQISIARRCHRRRRHRGTSPYRTEEKRSLSPVAVRNPFEHRRRDLRRPSPSLRSSLPSRYSPHLSTIRRSHRLLRVLRPPYLRPPNITI